MKENVFGARKDFLNESLKDPIQALGNLTALKLRSQTAMSRK